MEGDRANSSACNLYCHFNPLPPYGGRLPPDSLPLLRNQKFQSTPSVWRETSAAVVRYVFGGNFNPLPPYGGRLFENSSPGGGLVFQSTPSVWRETDQNAYHVGDHVFQSTPSVWRETNAPNSFLFVRSFQSTPSVWRETLV